MESNIAEGGGDNGLGREFVGEWLGDDLFELELDSEDEEPEEGVKALKLNEFEWLEGG